MLYVFQFICGAVVVYHGHAPWSRKCSSSVPKGGFFKIPPILPVSESCYILPHWELDQDVALELGAFVLIWCKFQFLFCYISYSTQNLLVTFDLSYIHDVPCCPFATDFCPVIMHRTGRSSLVKMSVFTVEIARGARFHRCRVPVSNVTETRYIERGKAAGDLARRQKWL